MAKTAILSVKIVSDGRAASAGFNQAAAASAKYEASARKVGAAVVKASAVAAVGLGYMGKKAIDAASDAQQAAGAVDSVFGNAAASVHKFASTAANDVGLARSEYENFAAVVGAQLSGLGYPQDQVAGKTNDLIRLGADLAATFGGSTQEAVTALAAAFRGEYDPIERFGVSIKQADINTRLASKGLGGLTGEAKKHAQAQEVMAMIMEKTAGAQGQFARESDTLAGQMQRANAQFKDALANLGVALLPVVTQLAAKFSGLAQAIGSNPAAVSAVVLALGGLAVAVLTVSAAVKTYQAAMTVVGAVQWVWNLAATKAVGAAIRTGLFWGRVLAMYVAAVIRDNAIAAAAWARTAAASVAAAVSTGAAWVAAQARMALGWAAMRARAAATFVAVAAQAVVQAAVTSAAWVAANARSALSFMLVRGAMIAGAVAAGVMTAAQWALNVALSANPLGLVIIAVVALVAALVLAYNKSETFRNIVQALGAVAGQVFSAIGSFIGNVIGYIGNLISKAGGIGGIFRSAMNAAASAVDVLMAPLRWLIGLISDVIGWISRIRFPSPPGWMKALFGDEAGPGTVFGVDPANLDMPDAAASSDLGVLSSIGRIARGGGTSSSGSVDNSVTINVTGALDPNAVAEQIRSVLVRDGRSRGMVSAVRL